MNLEIVEGNGVYWIVIEMDSMFGSYQIPAWHEPFVNLSEATNKLNKMQEQA